MNFKEECLNEFFEIFKKSSPRIRQFDGCISVKLVQDVKKAQRVLTISEWESEKALDLYRESELFKTTWAATKLLFSEKAQAWSTKEIQ